MLFFLSGQEVRSHRAPGTAEVAAQLQRRLGAVCPAGGGPQQTGASGFSLQQPQEQHLLSRKLQPSVFEPPNAPGESDAAALVLLPQESFNILDCGIYRVISRRGSQSEEETSSLINHSMSEEERLKEFSFTQEEDQADHGRSPRAVTVSLRLQVYKLPYFNNIIHIFLCSYLFLICRNLFYL